jgi:hypothetical protein
MSDQKTLDFFEKMKKVTEIINQTFKTEYRLIKNETYNIPRCEVHFSNPNGAALFIGSIGTYGQTRDKCHISGLFPPQYYPSRSHSINVSHDRDPYAIARDIKNRLIPDYFKAFIEQMKAKNRHDDLENKKNLLIEHFALITNTKLTERKEDRTIYTSARHWPGVSVEEKGLKMKIGIENVYSGEGKEFKPTGHTCNITLEDIDTEAAEELYYFLKERTAYK